MNTIVMQQADFPASKRMRFLRAANAKISCDATNGRMESLECISYNVMQNAICGPASPIGNENDGDERRDDSRSNHECRNYFQSFIDREFDNKENIDPV